MVADFLNVPIPEPKPEHFSWVDHAFDSSFSAEANHPTARFALSFLKFVRLQRLQHTPVERPRPRM